MYVVDEANDPLLKLVALFAMFEDTIVVFDPATGAAPLEFPKEGTFGDMERKRRYPEEDAPEDGKVAAFHVKSIALDEEAVATKFVAWEVVGAESVLNVFSSP